jgi:hypothetical protein
LVELSEALSLALGVGGTVEVGATEVLAAAAGTETAEVAGPAGEAALTFDPAEPEDVQPASRPTRHAAANVAAT